jgi:hypothetical protein
MSVRPLIALYLLTLCAITPACGPSGERKAEEKSFPADLPAAAERRGAQEKFANEQRAAAAKARAEEQAAARAAAEREAAEARAAAEKRAAEEKAAADSYVTLRVEVELRGVLSCTDEAASVSIVTHGADQGQFTKVEWVLDFGEAKDLHTKAKSLHGKTVLVKGSAILRGIASATTRVRENRSSGASIRDLTEGTTVVTKSVLDVEPKVALKSLVQAMKE